MKLLRIPAVLISIAVIGCSSTVPVEVVPTFPPTDIPSTSTASPPLL